MKNRDEMFCLDTNTFNGGLGISPHQRRSIEEKVASTGKEIEAMFESERWGLLRKKMVSMIADAGTDDPAVMQAVENKRWELMFKPRGNIGAASPLFARVPDYNNELLLLL